MNDELSSFIKDLYAKGREFDAAEPEWSRRWRNIDPEVGEFLWIFSKSLKVKDVLEIGTSNGYSTLWLGDAARDNLGKVTTVEHDEQLAKMALSNIAQAGLSEVIDLRCCDGGTLLSELPAECVDLLFLDADRPDYARWWPHPMRVLRSGGVLIADNMTSHPDELEVLYSQIQDSGRFSTAIIPVGKGELVALKD